MNSAGAKCGSQAWKASRAGIRVCLCVGVHVCVCNCQKQNQAKNQHPWKAPSVCFRSFPQLGRYRWRVSRITCQTRSCQKLNTTVTHTLYQPAVKLFQRESDKHIYACNSPERVVCFLRALMNQTTARDAAIRYSCPFLLWQLTDLFDGEGKGNKAGG